MPEKLVRVKLGSIKVLFNGDDPPGHPGARRTDHSERNNSIVATLLYPRSGAPQVVSVKAMDLENDVERTFALPNFWESGLFKEKVHGETVLKIQVIDRDKKSGIEKWFLKVLAWVIGGGLGAAAGGIANVCLGAVAKGMIGDITGGITGSPDEQKAVIGETKPLFIGVVNELEVKDENGNEIQPDNGIFKLELEAPADLTVTQWQQTPAGIQWVDKSVLTKGGKNGYVALQITMEAV